jgi:Histidine kinase
MSTLESAIARTTTSRTSLRHFIGNAWRSLTLRQLGVAVAIGLGLGSVQGFGAALWQTKQGWWESYLACVTSAIYLSVAFLLCIVVAAEVRTKRMPRWLPYITAATLAVVIATVFDIVIMWLIKSIGEGGVNSWPGANLPLGILLWINVPPMLLMCYLAALGYLQYRDSVSGTDALRFVQMERATLAREAYVARLQAMQAHVEPQFLFDTLGHVEQLYEDDPDRAERMLDDLIVYLRAALPGLTAAHSTLGVEFTLAGAWLDIMKIRMRDRLAVAMVLPEVARETRVPPMVLLPLIDDAVRSSMTSMRNVETIAIEASIANARLRLHIRTSGAIASGTIDQVRERLHAVYSQQASVVIRANAYGGGAEAVIDIPFEPELK